MFSEIDPFESVSSGTTLVTTEREGGYSNHFGYWLLQSPKPYNYGANLGDDREVEPLIVVTLSTMSRLHTVVYYHIL
jgi:hypothetical protein